MATKKKVAKKKVAKKKATKKHIAKTLKRLKAVPAMTKMPVTDLDGNKLGEVMLTKELWERLRAKSLVPAVQVESPIPVDDKQMNLLDEVK